MGFSDEANVEFHRNQSDSKATKWGGKNYRQSLIGFSLALPDPLHTPSLKSLNTPHIMTLIQ
jgi:hypothetical protein